MNPVILQMWKLRPREGMRLPEVTLWVIGSTQISQFPEETVVQVSP